MEDSINELSAIYAEIADAFRNKDLDGITKYISPDWKGFHGDSIATRDQLLDNLNSQFQEFNEISWPRTIGNARVDGETVTVRAEGHYHAVKAVTGEPFDMDIANDDTWANGPDGWQNISSTGPEA